MGWWQLYNKELYGSLSLLTSNSLCNMDKSLQRDPYIVHMHWSSAQHCTNFCLVTFVASKQTAFKHSDESLLTTVNNQARQEELAGLFHMLGVTFKSWLRLYVVSTLIMSLTHTAWVGIKGLHSLTVKNTSTWAYTRRLHFQHDKDGQVWQF